MCHNDTSLFAFDLGFLIIPPKFHVDQDVELCEIENLNALGDGSAGSVG